MKRYSRTEVHIFQKGGVPVNSKKQPKQETKEIAPYGYNGFKTEIRMNRSMKHYIDQCIGYSRRCWNRMVAEYKLEK